MEARIFISRNRAERLAIGKHFCGKSAQSIRRQEACKHHEYAVPEPDPDTRGQTRSGSGVQTAYISHAHHRVPRAGGAASIVFNARIAARGA